MSDGNQQWEDDDYDDAGQRQTWAILSWIILVLTIVLNIAIIIILVVKKNFYNVINKGIIVIALVDMMYGLFVSPFFVENYIHNDWKQSLSYCRFFIFFYTFHDLFVPLVLMLMCTYISLKFAGVAETLNRKRLLYIGSFLLSLVISVCLSIPATAHAGTFKDHPLFECRTWDKYTMVISFFLASSLLFCFTMSFLFSLCIVGSPFLRGVFDKEAYTQRWRLLLTISLVNIFFILCGFMLNLKEASRFMRDCCQFEEPFRSFDTLTYDIVSFVLLIAEPCFRPFMYIVFYLRYLLRDADSY